MTWRSWCRFRLTMSRAGLSCWWSPIEGISRADLTLASPEPGQAAARAARSLSASLEQLEPVLRTVKDKLVASAPEHFTVEFGVKLGGETGIILAKGTAEVNLKITMTWDRQSRQAGDASGRV